MAPGRPEDIIWLRPEHAAVGRPAQRSRAEITAVAVAVADRDGLAAVSMRRVAADLGTGAASLYRYVDTREDLLDLMTDSTAAEYSLTAPSGYWLADLVEIGEQARAIMRRHPWLVTLVATRPTLGPHGVALLEHVLDVLHPHPADPATKLEAFAMLNAITVLFVQSELAGGSATQRRNAGYLQHIAASGDYPRIAQLFAQVSPAAAGPADQAGPANQEDQAGWVAPADPADRYAGILTRVLTGLLGPAAPPG